MTDTKKLKELAERARDKGDWYEASSVDAFPEFHVDQEFMMATSPDVVLWLIAEVERIKAENEALLLGMRAILNAYDYADQYNKEGVAVEVMEDLRTLFKGATQ
ncbi:TPA: hypothetical protein L5G00_002776 [Pseudomonas aeruginosa]|nr:hypothetical protein [Pseudomonas aeruginosa]